MARSAFLPSCLLIRTGRMCAHRKPIRRSCHQCSQAGRFGCFRPSGRPCTAVGFSAPGAGLAEAGFGRAGYFASGVTALDRAVSPALWAQDSIRICFFLGRRTGLVGRVGRAVPGVWGTGVIPCHARNPDANQVDIHSSAGLMLTCCMRTHFLRTKWVLW